MKTDIIQPSESTENEDQQFLAEGDWITIGFHKYYLYSRGFKSSQLALKNFKDNNPISAVFVIELSGDSSLHFKSKNRLVHYGQKVLLRHLLSGKYLSYSLHSSLEEVQLKYSRSVNSLFSIKPFFCCQANFYRKIRTGQQICLQSLQKLKVCIEIGQKNWRQAECLVHMKKHEQTILLVNRVNLIKKTEDQLTNLQVCQLISIQTQNTLQAQINQQNVFNLAFSSNINMFGSFITIEPLLKDQTSHQTLIQYNQPFLMRFYSFSLFLGLNKNNQLNLYSQPQQNCTFQFQCYDDDELRELSTVKLKHIESGLYVGLNMRQAAMGPFKLGNTFKLKRVDNSLLKITLLVNELYSSFLTLLRERDIFRSRIYLQQLFKQLIRFIYPTTFDHQQFLKLTTTISIKITANEQNLLANVGFIQLFMSSLKQFVNSLQGTTQGRLFFKQSITNIMIVLTGICHGNKANVQLLTPHLPILYENIGVATGTIQALFYIFQDHNNLQMMERIQHRIKKIKYRSIELLLQNIQKQRGWEIHNRAKLLKLLKCLLKSTQGQKMFLHQFSLIRAVRGDKLKNVLFKIESVGEDIEVDVDKQKQQLSEIIQKKYKYSKQLEAIRAQLNFTATLYSRPNPSSLAYFRQQFSQNVLLNYLKTNIPIEDKAIFLKMLNQIYLQTLPKAATNIVFLRNQPELKKRSYDVHILQKIKAVVLEGVKKGITNQIIDQTTSLMIQAVKLYNEAGLMEFKEWQILLDMLQNYFKKNYHLLDKSKDVQQLAFEMFKLIERADNTMIEQYARQITMILKEQLSRIPRSNTQMVTKTIQKCFFQLLNQSEFNVADNKRFDFLNKIIEFTVNNNDEVFHRACQLMKIINNRSSRLIQKLRWIIMIDSTWLQNILVQLYQLHYELVDILGEYRHEQEERGLVGISLGLTKKLKEINQYFYKWESPKHGHSISPLMQNVIRQVGLFGTMMTFTKDQQRQLRTKRSRIFTQIFHFMWLFLFKNQANIRICAQDFSLMKWLFTYEQVGQSKILYLLITNHVSHQLLRTQLCLAALLSLKASSTMNCFGMLSILSLINNNDNMDKRFIEEITSKIIEEPSLIQHMIKSEQQFEINVEQQSSNNDQLQFGYYMFLVIHLLLILTEHSTHSSQLIELLATKIRIQNLLQLLLGKDMLQEMNLSGLGRQLMKEQIIMYFGKLYPKYFETANQADLAFCLNFCFQLNTRLMAFKPEQQKSLLELTEINYNLHSLHIQCLKIKFNKQILDVAPTLHLTIIACLYPFMLTVSQSIMNKLVLADNLQIKSIRDQAFRKLKQLMVALNQDQYRKHKKQYNLGIIKCEEILENKLGFELQDEDELVAMDKLCSHNSNELLRNQKISMIIDNCLTLSKMDQNSLAVRVYKAFMHLIYAPSVSLKLQSKQKLLNPLQNEDSLFKIADLACKALKSKTLTGQECIDLFWLFADKHPHLSNFIMNFDIIQFKRLAQLIINSECLNFNSLLMKYTFVSNQLMQSLIASGQISQNHIFKDSFISYKDRLQMINLKSTLYFKIHQILMKQKMLYHRTDIWSHLTHFKGGSATMNLYNNQKTELAQEILTYIANKFIISNNSNKLIIMPMLPDVFQLFRTYIRFAQHFQLLYLPAELNNKIQLCLKIIFYALTPAYQEVTSILLEGRYYNQFTTILKFDDCWEVCCREHQMSYQKRLISLTKSIQHGWQHQWVQNVMNLSVKSKQFYGESITFKWAGFPLQNTRSHYGSLKRKVVLILKELKQSQTKQSNQFLKRMDIEVIKDNIFKIFYKHFHLFRKYKLASLNPKLAYKQNDPLYPYANSLIVQNGLDLTALKMYIDNLTGKTDLQDRYTKYCENQSTLRGFLAKIKQFFKDGKNLLCFGQQTAEIEQRQNKIYQFFYRRMGRVQVLVNDRLVQVQFLIRPQCLISSDYKYALMQDINLSSAQLKLQSILEFASDLDLLFDEQQQFAVKYGNFKVIVFLQKYHIMIKILNLILIYLDNFYLIMNNSNNSQFYTNFNIRQPFQILLVINFILTLINFIIYNMKQVPIIMEKLKRMYNHPSSKYKQYSKNKLRLSFITKLLLNSEFIYNTVFLIIMGLVFLNKIFITILVLDILIQIRQMKILLLTIWQGKAQIILAFIFFLLFHYFFAIVIFIVLNNRLQSYCKSLGQCFGFIIYLSYRQQGGYPGYIYAQQVTQQIKNVFTLTNIIDNFYIIMSSQIFNCLFIVIIIDYFSKISRKKTQHKQSLRLSCLICGFNRTIFNMSSKINFKIHIAAHHNVWNYIFYYHYLRKKSISQRTSSELFILKNQNTDWIPNQFAKGFVEPETKANEAGN